MADTFTTHYNLTKPQVGGDPDTWGGLLNTNFDTIDSQLYTASTYALPLTGGTLTGALVAPELDLNAAAGNFRDLYVKTAGTNRWRLGATGTAESGSNAGSDFELVSYNDAGAGASTVLGIVRSTGVATFSARPVFGAATPWDSANFTPSNYAPLSGATFTGGVTIQRTSADYNALVLNNTSGVQIQLDANANVEGNLRVVTNHQLTFSTNNTTRLTIAAGGNATFTNVVTAPDFSATSDPRLKDRVRKLRRGVDALREMVAREYVKYEDENFYGEGREEVGFLATEVRNVLPEAVYEGEDGYLRVSHSQITALLASAILEIDRRLSLEGL